MEKMIKKSLVVFVLMSANLVFSAQSSQGASEKLKNNLSDLSNKYWGIRHGIDLEHEDALRKILSWRVMAGQMRCNNDRTLLVGTMDLNGFTLHMKFKNRFITDFRGDVCTEKVRKCLGSGNKEDCDAVFKYAKRWAEGARPISYGYNRFDHMRKILEELNKVQNSSGESKADLQYGLEKLQEEMTSSHVTDTGFYHQRFGDSSKCFEGCHLLACESLIGKFKGHLHDLWFRLDD